MKITSILKKEAIIPELHTTSKVEVLKELVDALHLSVPNIDPHRLVKLLKEREELGSTGVGSGVAIPHAKYPDLENIVAAFGKSSSGIIFDAQDGQPVHLFFALVAPEHAAGLHLKVLAKLSRLLKEESFRQRLLAANDPELIYSIILEKDD